MNLKRIQKAGFTLIELMIVVAIIGLLAGIAIPVFARSRTTSQQNACIHNLRLIDGAVQQWALENKAGGDDLVLPENIKPYLTRNANIDKVLCPASGAGASTFTACYSITTVGSAPVCQIGGAFPQPHRIN